MNNSKYLKEVIGIDLGGTGIKAGRIEREQIVSMVKNPTPQTTKAEKVTSSIIETIEQIIQPSTQAIGIGIPSVVDTEKGIVYDATNIPSWKEVGIKDILETEFNVPVHVNNDANCFAIGEKIYGEGKNCQNFVGLTLGTGLGAGIIQNGRLFSDANCGSGEFCVVPYLDADYENYCSSLYFKKLGTEGQELYEKAISGDNKSLQIFMDFGYHIAQLIKLVVATIDPQMIFFGGSISKAFHLFEKATLDEIQNFAYPNSISRLKIKVSSMQNQAIFGAAALCY